MAAYSIHFSEYVEPKWVDVKVQSFVIQKQLRQKTQILTVNLVVRSINLENRDGSFPINLFPHRLSNSTLNQMLLVGFLKLHVLEAVFTDPEFGLFTVLLRIRREIPSVNLILADLDFVDVLDFRESLVLLFKSSCCWVHFFKRLYRKR